MAKDKSGATPQPSWLQIHTNELSNEVLYGLMFGSRKVLTLKFKSKFSRSIDEAIETLKRNSEKNQKLLNEFPFYPEGATHILHCQTMMRGHP